MCSVQWLNKLLFFEAFLGIYRNYCTQKKITKFLIVLQILIQTVLRIIVVISEICSTGILDVGSEFTFSMLAAAADLVTIATVLYGTYKSRTFMCYYDNICRISKNFEEDKKMFRIIKIVYMFCSLFIISIVMYTLGKYLQQLMMIIHANRLIWFIIYMTSQATARIILVSQQLMLYVDIMILVVLTKCLISVISMIRNKLEGDHETSEQYGLTKEQIQMWDDVYRDLTDSCEKLTLCFGFPFLLSLILSLFQYIVASYSIFCIYILDKGGLKVSTEECVIVILILLVCVFVMSTPLFAGQLVNNEGTKLLRELAGLYNVMITVSDEADAKMVKDFIRVIKKNPLKVKLLTKSAGMYMLPVILSLAVNYLIVMLQFNHVI